MPRRRNSLRNMLAGGLLVALANCNPTPVESSDEAASSSRASLGLMTSLPLYWPLGAEFDDLAAGRAAPPWQRGVIETRYALVPIDTLSPVPALSANAPEVDPLSGITRLAVIQPRGLSPADNVALDQWVRGGGRLIMALDPMLTGDYDLPLGDPRRPVDAAPIPPVVARWGLSVSFDEGQEARVTTNMLVGADLPVALAGQIAVADAREADCTMLASGTVAQCRVGKGRVTLIADAALFEHIELAGEDGEALLAVLAAALD